MSETREQQIDRETRVLRAFQHEADAITHLIVNTDLPWIDIALQINHLREEAQRVFPQKLALFEMVYTSRFQRLWQQWRSSSN